MLFSQGWTPSIVTAERLNCCVRHGNRCFPRAMGTEMTPPREVKRRFDVYRCFIRILKFKTNGVLHIICRTPITSQMHLSLSPAEGQIRMRERKKSMDLLVRFGYIHYCTYTLRLSTRSSFWGLIGKSNLEVSFTLNMLSAFICSAHSYPAMPLV